MNFRLLKLTLLSVVITCAAFSQQPDTDAVYNKIIKEYTVNEDGSTEFHFRKELKLLTYFSFHRLFGETFIIYDPRYQELQINECYTLMADGTRVDAPGNAFNEVLPGFGRDLPALNPIREMVVTHTGLEVGATIHLDYTIRTEASFQPFLFASETIGEDVPVEEMEVIVKVPAALELRHKMINLRTAPVISMTAGKEVFIWKFKGLKALPRESLVAGELFPRLLFTTGGDWNRMASWISGQAAFREGPGEALTKKAGEARKGAKDELAVILALQDLVTDGLRTADVPHNITGFRVRTPDVCWQSTWATPMEKAIILRSLLLQAGINAEVAAVIPDLNFDEYIGDPAVIESFLVQVNPKKEERIYLSVSQKNDQSMLYNLDGKVVIVLNPAQESMRSFREKGTVNAASLEGQLNILDTARVSGVMTLTATGYRNPFLKLSRNESAVNTLLGGSLKAGSVSSSEFIKRSFEMTETKMVLGETAALKKYGNYLFLDLPYVTGGPDSWGLGLLSTARESALRLPYAFEEHYRFRIALPEGMALASPQNRIEISNAAGKLVYDLNLDGDVIQVEKSFVVFSALTEPANYAAFLELTQAWGLQHLKTLIFLAE